MKIEQIRKEVKRLTGCASGKPYRIGVVLLSAAVVGPSVPALATFTRWPRRVVEQIVIRARKTGIFTAKQVRGDWFSKDGGVAFNCDLAVMLGLLKRT